MIHHPPKLIPRNIESKDFCVIQFENRDRKIIAVENNNAIVLYLNSFLVEEIDIQYFWYITEEEMYLYDMYLSDIPNNDWTELYQNKL